MFPRIAKLLSRTLAALGFGRGVASLFDLTVVLVKRGVVAGFQLELGRQTGL